MKTWKQRIFFPETGSKKKGDTSHEVNDRSLVFFKIRAIVHCLYSKGERL